MVYRALRDDDVILRAELDELAGRRGVEVHYVVGGHDGGELLSPERLQALMPDIAARDVYVCGPPAMVEATRATPRPLGRLPAATSSRSGSRFEARARRHRGHRRGRRAARALRDGAAAHAQPELGARAAQDPAGARAGAGDARAGPQPGEGERSFLGPGDDHAVLVDPGPRRSSPAGA